MYYKELHISHEVDQISVKAFAQRYNCDCILLREYGPAGGNPLYLFSAQNKTDLQKLTDNIYGA